MTRSRPRQLSSRAEQMVELAERYQLPSAEPDWLPDVIARYGLTPPGAGGESR